MVEGIDKDCFDVEKVWIIGKKIVMVRLLIRYELKIVICENNFKKIW